MKRIAVICERDRAYGRGVCLGISDAAGQEKDWSLEFIDDIETVKETRLSGFDGVIARVANERIASDLKKTKLPVVDVYSDAIRPMFGSVDGDQPGIGRLAAEYLLSRRYKNFAYCGYDGIGWSDVRCRSFVEALENNGHGCEVFHASKYAVGEYSGTLMRREFVGLDSDTAPLSCWLKSLPKQTAVFCCHDVRAWQVVSVCRTESIPVPRHLAVLGVDNDELICSFTTPKISSIDNSAFQIGKESVRILSRMLASSKIRKNPPHVVIGARGVCERDSTPICHADAEWVADVMEYISRNVEKCVRVDEVAAFANRSVASVERGIRNVTGNTVQHHILWTRIETAKKLLLFSQKPIAEVSRLSGFASPQYFSRFFKNRIGITAEEFRNRGV